MILIKHFVTKRAVARWFYNDFIKRTFPDTVTNAVFTNSFPRFSMTSLREYGTSQFCVHVTNRLFWSMFIIFNLHSVLEIILFPNVFMGNNAKYTEMN